MHENFKIEFFQFDNLIKNRIPFVFIHSGHAEFGDLYDWVELQHIEKWTFPLPGDGEIEDVMTQLQVKKIDRRTPVVIMADSGDPDPLLIARLEELGYSNIYGVQGGWEALSQEAKAGF